MAKKKDTRDRRKEYGVSLNDIIFGDLKIQLWFDDIIETEDGWEPIPKREYNRTKCKRMYDRNSTMDLRKDVKFFL